jgi:hypothetical protein
MVENISPFLIVNVLLADESSYLYAPKVIAAKENKMKINFYFV